jgi:hypothetical protein
MDDHHDQPIWPMIQGAANYAWNLIEEVWALVWSPAGDPRTHAVREDMERANQAAREMREVDSKVTMANDTRATSNL